MKRLPTFWYERRLWNRGYKIVVGLDEVGRGAWAGPLVVGAVAFIPGFCRVAPCKGYPQGATLQELGVDDSKRLTPKRREELAEIIKKEALAWTVVEVPVSIINRVGIGKATQMGFRKAIKAIGEVDFALIDAFYVQRAVGLPKKKRQLAIVHGDRKSVSIAAASIVAKVYRDNLMRKISQRYRKYDWSSNVGYGTLKHCKAIRRYGLTRWHRKQFVESGLGKIRIPQKTRL